jgi:hypothetical protein
MRTIHLITTGGTIEKAYSEPSGAVLHARSKVARYLEQLRLHGQVFPVDNVRKHRQRGTFVAAE